MHYCSAWTAEGHQGGDEDEAASLPAALICFQKSCLSQNSEKKVAKEASERHYVNSVAFERLLMVWL